MKPYSIDLRQKIIDVKLEENLSIRRLAERFKVSKNFVQKLLKQYRETGSIEPKKSGKTQNKKLTPEQVVTLIEIIDNNNDATLKEIGEILTEKTQVKVSKTTIWKLTKKNLIIHGKKRHFMQRKKLAIKCNKKDGIFGK